MPFSAGEEEDQFVSLAGTEVDPFLGAVEGVEDVELMALVVPSVTDTGDGAFCMRVTI